MAGRCTANLNLSSFPCRSVGWNPLVYEGEDVNTLPEVIARACTGSVIAVPAGPVVQLSVKGE